MTDAKKRQPDLEAIDLMLERAETYVLAVIREALRGSADRSPSTLAARRVLVDTIVDLVEEGRFG